MASLKAFFVALVFVCLISPTKPDRCCEARDSEKGPHTLGCLTKWWLEAGCSVDGTNSPTAPRGARGFWNGKSVGEVKNDMTNYRKLALKRQSGHGTTYMKLCYGDSGHCGGPTTVGPHPAGCLMGWWLSAGCSPAGLFSPNNKQTGYWDGRDVTSVRADMRQYRVLSLQGKSGHGRTYTEWCYGERYQGCSGARGPHRMYCLMQWWLAAGCTADGAVSPNRNRNINLYWNAHTVSPVKADMANYHKFAVLGRSNKHGKSYRVLCGI